MPIFFFALSLLVSSSLLMLVQPMAARMMLPHLGGSPSVWNTCMVFFQTGLLIGYAYAHFGPKLLGSKLHAVTHAGLILAMTSLLPIDLPAPNDPPTMPALWLLKSLLVGVAAPFILLAASGPLFQRWFAQITDSDPYFLYSASNLGSFAGLLAYPFWMERFNSLAEQSRLWATGYAVLGGVTALAAMMLVRAQSNESARFRTTAPPLPRRIVRWILLAAAPSSLMLSVTNHITTDLAPIPFLWIVPFGLYLLTFSIAFARRPIIDHVVVRRYARIMIFFLAFFLLSEATAPFVAVVGFPLIGFFWLTLYCHGELADSKPEPDHLTAFYFWLALGGVLGGAFNALLAPLVFSSHLEYPLILILIGLLMPQWEPILPINRWDLLRPLTVGLVCVGLVFVGRGLEVPAGPIAAMVMFVGPLFAMLFMSRPLRYALTLAAILLASSLYPGVHGPSAERSRSFFGVHRVTQQGDLVKMIHGDTDHGVQSLSQPREPLAYYHRESPVGVILECMKGDVRLGRVGLVGLGAGALAAYGQRGQHWTYFEIDPEVIRLAHSRFTYLKNSQAKIEIVLGDARLSLRQPGDKFGMLIIDAFGSDSIPTHLLTTQALDVYGDRLTSNGLLMFHVSNRYLDLHPMLAAVGGEKGWFVWGIRREAWPAQKELAIGRSESWWIVMARDRDHVAGLDLNIRWQPLIPLRGHRPWTDDFAPLHEAIHWRALFE